MRTARAFRYSFFSFLSGHDIRNGGSRSPTRCDHLNSYYLGFDLRSEQNSNLD